MSGSSGAEFVLVRRRDLERLTTEVMQMKEFLPQILNQELLSNVQRLEQAESALDVKESDCEHFRSRLEAAQSECLQEKEEKLSVLAQLSSLQEQSLQQAEFCTLMGSTLCTLLWGVSSREEAVRSLLGGGKAVAFFGLASQTLSSYVESLEQPQDEEAEESQFVLGLAGTITNIAAVSFGREFLVTTCRDLLETWIHLLGRIKPGTCCRLRVLMLMSLYNVSINRKGVSWMSQNVSLISQLQRLLTDRDPDVCLHTLRLLQSVALESDGPRHMQSELHKCLPRIVELAQSRSAELQTAAGELLEEMRALEAKG
ncbi:heat shock factor 2-binding protein [Spea bombifrons]|uniref:heat shock factor 2-binding protein n=1 Tax=Spea bombifrons TaxID=233779 RepID=UPI00234A104C|nr:heat shock factor 2-binding protein [Spea bombifrons]